ncbi:MAG: DUF4364 family protein [Lachnospiraceae bacterium]|nr:DUF4364 family protein [Lachnospiraceae bacterium]
MLQDPLTLYKLIVLYMLNRVSFPITPAQISEFILEKEYTNYLTLQQVIGELSDANMIHSQTTNNRTLLTITEEGRETLNYFENRISDTIKEEILTYFRDNEFDLLDEVSVQSNYYKSTTGDYEAHLIAKERGANLIELKLSVPDKETATTICDNWQDKNQDIYQYIIKQLF